MSIHYELEKISSNIWYCPKCKKRVTPKPPIDYETLDDGKEIITGFCPFNKCAPGGAIKGFMLLVAALTGHLYRRKFTAFLCMMHLDAKAAVFVRVHAC